MVDFPGLLLPVFGVFYVFVFTHLGLLVGVFFLYLMIRWLFLLGVSWWLSIYVLWVLCAVLARVTYCSLLLL